MIIGYRCKKGAVKFKECLNCKDPCIPRAFRWAMINSCENRGSGISATAITQCLKKTYYERSINYYENILKAYVPFRGTMFHQILELYPGKEVVQEERFSRKIEGIEISGKPDLLCPDDKTLWDWKTTKACPCVHKNGYTRNIACNYYEPYPEALKISQDRKKPLPPCNVINCPNEKNEPYGSHGLQLNIYRWILEDKYEINHLKFFYMDMSNVRILEAKIIDIEPFIKERVPLLKKCLDEGIEPPAEPSWLCNYCHFKNVCKAE